MPWAKIGAEIDQFCPIILPICSITKDLSLKESKKLLVKKCMGLTVECIRANVFVAVDYQEPVMRQEQGDQDTQVPETAAQNERGMALCSQ